jgi:hypothetical protein
MHGGLSALGAHSRRPTQHHRNLFLRTGLPGLHTKTQRRVTWYTACCATNLIPASPSAKEAGADTVAQSRVAWSWLVNVGQINF